MITKLRTLVFVLLTFAAFCGYAQAPTVSYSSPQIYSLGNTITPLAPVSNGVTALAYSSTLKSSGLPVGGDVAFDKAGNLYVADTEDGLIIKFPVVGGSPDTVYTGGPTSLVVDGAGNIYTADQNNYRLVKIPAGGGTPVNVGQGQARFVAADAAGNIFYTDNDNNVIWEVYPNGGYTQFDAGFNNPSGIAVDAAGNVYIGNNSNQILKIPPTGGTPVVLATGFNFPEGMIFDAAGNLYIADGANNLIKEIPVGSTTPVSLVTGINNPEYIALDPHGNLNVNGLTEISPTGGYFLSPMLPPGLKFSSSTGIISGTPTAVSPATNYIVTAYNANGGSSSTFSISVRSVAPATLSYTSPQNYIQGTAITPLSPTSSGVAAAAYGSATISFGTGLSLPWGVAIDAAGNIYVADQGNNAVKRIPAGGGTPIVLGSGFNGPTGVAVDASGNVYVADQGNNAVKVIAASTGTISTVGSGFSGPTGVALDALGNIYVADFANNAVKEIPAGNGTVMTFGSNFKNPASVAVDAAGNIYVADYGNNAVKEIPAGNGAPVTLGSGFAGPSGVAVDPVGNVFVGDQNHNLVKEIPVGNATPVSIGSGFNGAAGVAVDGAGNVYVGDYLNNLVKEVSPVGGYYLSAALPSGLNFNTSTGVISGTPTTKSPAINYTVTAYNAGGPSSAIVNLDVTLFPLSYGSAQTFNTGVAITPITPVSSGVAAPGYNNVPAVASSAVGELQYLSADTQGNLYCTAVYVGGTVEVIKIPAGGSPVVLASYPTTGSYPVVATADASGNVYYINQNSGTAGNGTLYKIAAGSNTSTPILSSFYVPFSIATDGAGNVYVGDNDNGVSFVEEIPAGGNTATIINTYTGINAMTVNQAGDLYLAARGAQSGTGYIYKINKTTAAADTLTTNLTGAGIALDAGGNIYQIAGNGIYQITAGGGGTSKLIAADNETDGSGPGIFYAENLAMDGAGNVYCINVADNHPPDGYYDIDKIIPAGGYYINPGLPEGLVFNTSTGVISGTPTVASPATTYTITAYNSSSGSSTATITLTVNLVNPTVAYSSPQTFSLGTPITPLAPASNAVSPPGYNPVPLTISSLQDPFDVVVDGAGNVYVSAINGIYKTPSGGGAGAYIYSNGQFSGDLESTAVAVDATGNVYFTAVTLTSGAGGGLYKIAAGSTNFVPVFTALNQPFTVATDAAGNVYVGDATASGTVNIEEFKSGGGTPTILGNFAGGQSIAVDAIGSVYLNETTNGIVKISKGGARVDTINENGLNPTQGGIAVDGAGNIYTTGTDGIYEIPAAGGTPQKILADHQFVQNGPGVYYIGLFSIDAAGNLYIINNAENASNNVRNIVKINPIGGYYIAPTIPPGISFDNATGIISGTPTALSPATNYTVTAYNNYGGVTTQTINMSVVPSGTATLSMLAVSGGSLSPAFAAATTSYAVTVPYLTTSVTVTPTTSNVLATVKVNGVAVTSGTPSAAINLNVGANVITAVVTSEDGTTNQTYTINVTRTAPSAVNTLSNLQISSGALSPAFAAATTGYTESLNYSISTVTITPTVTDNTASVTVNGTPVTSGSASATITLFVGSNTITTVVTAQNGTTKTYTITVTREKSTNAGLSNIVLSKGTLAPVFATATTSYTAMVTNGTTSLTLTPTLANAQATVTVNGTAVTSGKASGAIALSIGTNTISTVVTAQDGVTTKTYTVTVIRPSTNAKLASLGISAGTLAPAFNTNTTNYTVPEINTTTSITVTPTVAVAGATITVNGIAVTSGAPSTAIALNVGGNNISIVVTAQDGVTTDTYTITANRAASTNANLAGLAVSKGTLSPVFSAATTSYTDMVTNGTTSLTITPTVADVTATVTVNGTTVVSGKASAAIALSVGVNAIPVAVTAQDGVTIKTYTINVIRPSTNSRLASLSLSSGTLAPVFSATTISYTASVTNTVSSITLTPTVAVAGATIKVNGTAVNSGSASGALALSVGANTITIIVTAQDGVTTTTYTVTITRAAVSTNDNLSALAISKGTLSPTFAAATSNYTDIVTNGTTSVTVTPTTADPGATVTINGTAVASGKASGAIALSVGSNTVTTIVTAQDGVTKQTYTVTVIRPSTNARLLAFTISSGTLTPAFNTNTVSYTASVTNATSSIMVTPTVAVTGATIKVNGITVTSGSPSAAIALSVGSDKITTVVTAQDGVTTDTYTLTVTRAAGSNNNVYQPVGVQNFEPLLQVADDGITVHQGVSPNGDGINDYLQIDNISNYPDNNLKIMTRNGLLVYEAKGYDNATKVFDGHSNKNGQMQLPGTYFYELDYTANGITKHKTGYLVLKY